jgi:hypothetical protein
MFEFLWTGSADNRPGRKPALLVNAKYTLVLAVGRLSLDRMDCCEAMSFELFKRDMGSPPVARIESARTAEKTCVYLRGPIFDQGSIRGTAAVRIGPLVEPAKLTLFHWRKAVR